MQIHRPRPSSRSVRWVNGIMATMYFLVLAMLLYFRLGPFRRVVARLETQGVELPVWFSLVFTVGVALVVVFLLWRGLSALRQALAPAGEGDETQSP